jgi:hypothetical protein
MYREFIEIISCKVFRGLQETAGIAAPPVEPIFNISLKYVKD